MEKEIDNDELSLKDLILIARNWFDYLLSKRKFILIVGLLGGIMGLMYAYLKAPTYEAELSFVVEDERSTSSGAYAGIVSQFGFDLGGNAGGVFQGDNLLALMQSRSMLQKALLTVVKIDGESKTLADLYIDINHLREKWTKKNLVIKDVYFLPGADPLQFSLHQNSIINDFHYRLKDNNLFVGKSDKKTNIISVRVNSGNELFSKYFAEALVKEVSDFYVETKTKKTSRYSITLAKVCVPLQQ